tara:strand:- start:1725 stop:2183 length:459 start_codon:yes stop_codon:yes gene_type:complete
MLTRQDAIKDIFNWHGQDSIYITNTGFISRDVYSLFPKNKNIFYMQGSMGLSPCIGLGIAANSQKDVVVISGDASLLMHLGITHTIEEQDLKNLFVYVLNNGCHESVGKFHSAKLHEEYNGINKIYKISNDGKKGRVSLDCMENTKQIKELL